MSNKEAPILKYTKIFVASWISGFFIKMADYRGRLMSGGGVLPDQLNMHKMATSSNYLKSVFIFTEATQAYHLYKRPASAIAILFTSFSFIANFFRDMQYSISQSLLRASFLISPFIVFYHFDRPVTNFWYYSLYVSISLCKNKF
jgi:hypothetical protein